MDERVKSCGGNKTSYGGGNCYAGAPYNFVPISQQEANKRYLVKME